MRTSAHRVTGSVPARVAIMALPFILLTAGVAVAGDPLPSRELQQQLAGTWVVPVDAVYRSYFACCAGPGAEAPFTPEYRKIRDAFASIPENTPEKTVSNLSRCVSPGVPGTFEHTLMFEFLLTDGRVNLIFQDGSFRRIWTDGRTFPETLTPTLQGYSVGRWEGKTLIVETRGISKQADLFVDGPIKATHQTKVTERMTVESDQILRLRVTIEDAKIFTAPYSYETVVTKIPISFEVGCAVENRNDSHKPVDLTLPDFDE